MKVTIYRFSLNHLWNSEYCMFVSQMVAIFLKYDAESLHLKKSFERVTDLMSEIEKIKAHEQGSIISNQLADLNTERRVLIKSVMDQVKTFGKLSMPALSDYIGVMNRFLDKHGRNIGELNYNANTEQFNDLLIDYNSNDEIKAAVEALHQTMLFEQLEKVNSQFADLYLQRTLENSSIEEVDTRAIRVATDKALTSFYDAIEFCSQEYEDLDYQTPANEMNDLIMHYKTQLKARATRRNAGKEVHTEEAIAQA